LYKEILINYTINTFTKNRILGIIGVLTTLIVPFLIMMFGSKNLENEQSFCPFKMLTGFPCAGCGITKSIINFYQGNLYKSISFHILGPLVVVFCVLIIFKLITELKTKKEYFKKYFYNKKIAYSFGIFLIVYHTIRIVIYIKNNSWDDILKASIWY
jgi:hypothetical protein